MISVTGYLHIEKNYFTKYVIEALEDSRLSKMKHMNLFYTTPQAEETLAFFIILKTVSAE